MQEWDRYAYTNNNPINYTDPSGHITCEELGTEECDENGNFIDEDNNIPPVIMYIYEEMMNNSVSDIAEIIKLENFLSDKTMGTTKINAFAIWGFMVRQGGPWDHKSRIWQMESNAERDPSYQRVGEWQFSFDTWSNIHYGFVGTAAGFTSKELLGGAGLEQIGTNIFSGSDIVSAPGVEGLQQYDDPRDQAGINLGIYLWSTYGLELKPEDILQALINWDGLNRKP